MAEIAMELGQRLQYLRLHTYIYMKQVVQLYCLGLIMSDLVLSYASPLFSSVLFSSLLQRSLYSRPVLSTRHYHPATPANDRAWIFPYTLTCAYSVSSIATSAALYSHVTICHHIVPTPPDEYILQRYVHVKICP